MSNDFAVGAPFNIAQYALLLHMLAQVVDMEVNELVYSVGDCHLYLDQIDQAKEQMTRTPLPMPTLRLNPDVKDLFAFTEDDISIEDYQHHEKIKYNVAT